MGINTILPASYICNPRDIQWCYHNAMSLVRKYGRPGVFLTRTCNTNWLEIQEHLLPGQVAKDYPGVVTWVFYSKCEDLKTDVFQHHTLGKVVAHVHIIEFQSMVCLMHTSFLYLRILTCWKPLKTTPKLFGKRSQVLILNQTFMIWVFMI